jgi:hypothetical protein
MLFQEYMIKTIELEICLLAYNKYRMLFVHPNGTTLSFIHQN